MASNNNQQPGLIASHAEYIKAAAVETVGTVTGSEAWKQSGAEQKEQAINDMKAASEGRDPSASGWGKPEEVIGKVTGCEGMQQEGAASTKQ
ncbi:hypothetical protein W97_06664 [Coniosporium apollinis CBS 100218]|uniref:Uncharacterized protein n=1 Tax=Coniosporium apollinis (strain CBS 100218) TaxID=1168221 RepID=R7Z0F0_CONA1|nr:uncharacterized protein W97_06664 [Coniosporium apollinis CBS 100218]EON67411.1 hypothetical protein W97_06664 [Coniosporium apollinis CBS 100218]